MRQVSATDITYWSRTSSSGCSATSSSAASAARARPSGPAEIGRRQHPLDPEAEERAGVRHRGAQRLGVGPGQLIRIGARRQCHHRHLDVVRLLPRVDTIGGGLARLVGVVGQNEPAGEALELADVLLGQSRAARGDRPLHPGPGEADHVGVALADHDLVAGHHVGLGPVDAVQGLRLVVEHVVA